MAKTALFGFPFPGGKSAPNGPLQIEEAVKAVEERLTLIKLLIGSEEGAAAPAAGQLLIVDGTAHPAYKAATGDWTINSAGVTTIGASKVIAEKIASLAVTAAKIASEAVETAKLMGLSVTTAKLAELAVTAGKLAAEAVETGKIKNLATTEAKLADAAVSTRKLKPTEGEAIYSGGEAWLGGANSNFAQVTISLATASIVHLVGAVHGGQRAGNGSAGQIVFDFYIDGFAQGRGGLFGFEQAPAIPGIQRTSAAIEMRAGLGAGSHTLSLQAHGTNNCEACYAPTGFKYVAYSQ